MSGLDPRLAGVVDAREEISDAEVRLDAEIRLAKSRGVTAEAIASAAGYATRRSVYQAVERAEARSRDGGA